MSYTIFRTSAFKKAYKKLSVLDKEHLFEIVNKLALGEVLDKKYKDRLLAGDFKGCRECHIRQELLLIYRIKAQEIELVLVEE
ncbi:MAG: RelE/StbE family addiction module toxin [Sulfuricurvum sp. PC08-66]|nr:MAG: RelE/StbE family addiction module toxin [Sulfuricurvum sp. PC08-66]